MAVTLPEGSFHANLDGDQIRALELVRKLGERLVSENPEIADYYRDRQHIRTHLDIAKMVIPDVAEMFPEVAKKSVGYALRKLVPLVERMEILHMRKQLAAAKNFDHSSEVQRQKSLIRHKLHGVDVNAMLEARGRTPWTADEKEVTRSLAEDASYLTPGGAPDYNRIAQTLNDRFHGGKVVRYENSVASFIKDQRRKKTSEHLPRWVEVPADILGNFEKHALFQPIEYDYFDVNEISFVLIPHDNHEDFSPGVYIPAPSGEWAIYVWKDLSEKFQRVILFHEMMEVYFSWKVGMEKSLAHKAALSYEDRFRKKVLNRKEEKEFRELARARLPSSESK
jgi:hypothetical protein